MHSPFVANPATRRQFRLKPAPASRSSMSIVLCRHAIHASAADAVSIQQAMVSRAPATIVGAFIRVVSGTSRLGRIAKGACLLCPGRRREELLRGSQE